MIILKTKNNMTFDSQIVHDFIRSPVWTTNRDILITVFQSAERNQIVLKLVGKSNQNRLYFCCLGFKSIMKFMAKSKFEIKNPKNSTKNGFTLKMISKQLTI